MEVRCLGCGTVFEWHPNHPMCPNRYASPHDPDFLEAVSKKLATMGATKKTSVTQHKKAIAAALSERGLGDSAPKLAGKSGVRA